MKKSDRRTAVSSGSRSRASSRSAPCKAARAARRQSRGAACVCPVRSRSHQMELFQWRLSHEHAPSRGSELEGMLEYHAPAMTNWSVDHISRQELLSSCAVQQMGKVVLALCALLLDRALVFVPASVAKQSSKQPQRRRVRTSTSLPRRAAASVGTAMALPVSEGSEIMSVIDELRWYDSSAATLDASSMVGAQPPFGYVRLAQPLPRFQPGSAI